MAPDVRYDAQLLLMVPERALERALALSDRPPASGPAQKKATMSPAVFPREYSTDEAPPDENSPGGMNRSFLVTSRVCSRIGSIPGSPSTLSALACSSGMSTLKSRTVV